MSPACFRVCLPCLCNPPVPSVVLGSRTLDFKIDLQLPCRTCIVRLHMYLYDHIAHVHLATLLLTLTNIHRMEIPSPFASLTPRCIPRAHLLVPLYDMTALPLDSLQVQRCGSINDGPTRSDQTAQQADEHIPKELKDIV